MSIELKIKNKHLAEESRIIRFEERKELKKANWLQKEHIATGNSLPDNWMVRSWYGTYYSINRHRRLYVRNENRATSLARAYLAGVEYNTVEHKRKPENEYNFKYAVIPRVIKMINKYGRVWDKETRSRPPEITEHEILKWLGL